MADIFIPVVQKTVTTQDNLFSVAAKYLGDATKWNQIAALNGLTDPFLTQVTTLKLPSATIASNGGIVGSP